MRRILYAIAVATVMMLVIWACAGEAGTTTTTSDRGTTTSEPTVTTSPPEATTTTPEETTTTTSEQDGPLEPPDLDPSTFSDPTTIDHKWAPMTPGHQIVLDGITVEEDEEIPHRIVFTITDATKVVSGVNSVVVWIQDYADDELVEAEIAFFAQDDEGNVWSLGEYPEEYEDGEIVDHPAWIDGFEDAKAGLFMPANPQEGTPSYAEGWGPAVGWDDRGRVFEVGSQTCVALGCYEDVLIIDEFSFEEPTHIQVKYYAPGIGNVQVGWKGDDPTKETLELVQVNTLDAPGLAEARAAALALEASALENIDFYADLDLMVVPG